MAAVRAIGAGLEHNVRDAARADVMKAVRSIVIADGVVADEMGIWVGSCRDSSFEMEYVQSRDEFSNSTGGHSIFSQR
jgi:hypothetical protein